MNNLKLGAAMMAMKPKFTAFMTGVALLYGAAAMAQNNSRVVSEAEKAKASVHVQSICTAASMMSRENHDLFDNMPPSDAQRLIYLWEPIKKECQFALKMSENDSRIVAEAEKLEALHQKMQINSANDALKKIREESDVEQRNQAPRDCDKTDIKCQQIARDGMKETNTFLTSYKCSLNGNNNSNINWAYFDLYEKYILLGYGNQSAQQTTKKQIQFSNWSWFSPKQMNIEDGTGVSFRLDRTTLKLDGSTRPGGNYNDQFTGQCTEVIQKHNIN